MSASSPSWLGTKPLESLGIPGGWSERKQVIGNHCFNLLAPADPVEFLNQLDESADVHVADPYWAAIWSASPGLAECVARKRWPADTSNENLGQSVRIDIR
ncbi:MAG: hypothetical protein ABGX16_14655 [Pirellulales bacterium]